MQNVDDLIARLHFAADLASPGSLIDEVAKLVETLHRDAERYRWLRDREHSLETRQYDKGFVNGPSCYHEVEGIRELKWGEDLDAAIDAATCALTKPGDSHANRP